MGFPEDQSESRVPRGLLPARDSAAAGGLARGFAPPPQKTLPQKPKDDGPEFDFDAPAVRSAEESLREAAVSLEESLQVSLEGIEGDGLYPAARAALETSLPVFYARYEDYIRSVTATGIAKVTCSKGCGHCCSHYVSSVEPFELIFLHGRVRRDPAYPSKLVAFHRRAGLFNSLLEGRRDEESDDRALFRYYLRALPCPFLSAAGECGVYEARPMSCRMFFSQSHPSLCRGKAAASPGNRNFIVELPGDIEATLMRASAHLSAFELPESLFEGLLEANALFGRLDQDEIPPQG